MQYADDYGKYYEPEHLLAEINFALIIAITDCRWIVEVIVIGAVVVEIVIGVWAGVLVCIRVLVRVRVLVRRCVLKFGLVFAFVARSLVFVFIWCSYSRSCSS
jgi:hypothetical protein